MVPVWVKRMPMRNLVHYVLLACWTVAIDGTVKEEVRKVQSVQKVIAGTKKFLMPCPMSKDSYPEVKWYKNDKPIDRLGSRFSPTEDSKILRIFNVARQDQGNYTCRSKSPQGVQRAVIPVLVVLPPQAQIIFPTNLTFKELTNQELVCRSRAFPRPSFEWLTSQHQRIKVSDRSESHSRMWVEERQIEEEVFESRLVLSPITFKDHGTFVCVAFNDVGHSRVSVTLNVFFSPKVVSEHNRLLPVVWWEGHSSNLTCVVAGNELPVITWARNGQPFSCRNLAVWTEESQIYSSCRIKRRQDGGPGTYSCTAENRLGNILVHEFHVKENFPPPPVDFSVVSSQLDEVILSVKIPDQENTPQSSYVLASYRMDNEDLASGLNPEYERMGDVDERGEGTVKLLGVRANTNYVVRIHARNSVGFGPETARVISTGNMVPTQPTPSTSRERVLSTQGGAESNQDDPGYEEIDSKLKDPSPEDTEKDFDPIHDLTRGRSLSLSAAEQEDVPRALRVKSLDNGASLSGRFHYIWRLSITVLFTMSHFLASKYL